MPATLKVPLSIVTAPVKLLFEFPRTRVPMAADMPAVKAFAPFAVNALLIVKELDEAAASR